MPTGGDGTAYYGEEVIDEKVMTKMILKREMRLLMHIR